MLKKIASVGIALIVFLSAVGVVTAEETGDGSAELKDTAVTGSADKDVTASQATELPEYVEYIQKNGSLKSATMASTVAVNADIKDAPLTVPVELEEDGFYTFSMTYLPLDDQPTDIEIDLSIDGSYLFDEMSKLVFPKIWVDSADIQTDGQGNQFASSPSLYTNETRQFASGGLKAESYLFYLTAGKHILTVAPSIGTFHVSEITLGVPETTTEYVAPTDTSKYYTGEAIVREGEKCEHRNSYWMVPQSDSSSIAVTPCDPVYSRINYMGGSNWQMVGDTITWKLEAPQDGYYALGFSYRQNQLINYNSYRTLRIDGIVPFAEAERVSFPYGINWEKKFYSDRSNTPYLFYLKEGPHEISLTVTLGGYDSICTKLEDVLASIEDMYVDMTMIIGETVDVSRDYNLFQQIPDFETRLQECLDNLTDIKAQMEAISGKKGGSYESIVQNMARVIRQMLENKYSASNYKANYYSNYSSLSECLNDMQQMPLDIDQIFLAAPGDKEAIKTKGGLAGFFSGIGFSTRRFVASFFKDYNNISGNEDSGSSITLWVNWGRDQARILNSMIQTSFTKETNISVNLRVTNASIVQAILSGNGPDCVLQLARTSPVDLAMRGALYDLSQFKDCSEVLERFAEGAEIPYYYKDGLYAIPDSQHFYMMFYRTDVLKKLNLQVPQTWDDFKEVIKILEHKNLTANIPYTQIQAAGTASVGIGSLGLFPSLLLQNQVPLYTDDLRSTTLTSPEVQNVFDYWMDYYTKLKLQVSLNFYNRFRAGTCPIGIAPYETAVMLMSEAPELDGKWEISQIPGTIQPDGTLDRTSSGGGTGCSILNLSKNPDAAWEFLKWWTRADVQTTYSNNLEAILGTIGRVVVSNQEAQKNLAWDKNMLSAIMTAWNNTVEFPEVPGGYQVARSIDMAYYNVFNSNMSTKDMLLKWGTEADKEIARKWEQYDKAK